MPRTKQFDRQEALDKAMNVFWEKGYNGASIQDLVEEMNINRSSMYDTFGEKHNLYKEALQAYKSKYGINSRYLKNKSPLEGIRLLIDDYVNSIVQDKHNKGCFILNSTAESSCHDGDVKAFLQTNLEEFGEMLVELLSNSQGAKEISSARSPEELSDFVIAALQGMRMMGRVTNDAEKLRRIADNILKSIK